MLASTSFGHDGPVPLVEVKAHILDNSIYSNRPKVQTLFYITGMGWADGDPAEQLPCVKMFCFPEAREVAASCRLQGTPGCVWPSWSCCLSGSAPGWTWSLREEIQPCSARPWSSSSRSTRLIWPVSVPWKRMASGKITSTQVQDSPHAGTPSRRGLGVSWSTRPKTIWGGPCWNLDENVVLSVPLNLIREGDTATFWSP